MTALRVFLILVSAGILFLMAACPPLYDSHRSFVAHRNYYANSNQTTLRELNAAKKLDRRDIRVFETIMTIGLLVCGIAFAKTRRHEGKSAV
jgi:hypothetical protein